jgi:hypothetical protein
MSNKKKESVTDADIMVLFGDLRYFNNCGGDIENLITQIASVNNERSIGKHPLVNIHHLRIFFQNMIWKKVSRCSNSIKLNKLTNHGTRCLAK